MEYGKNVNLINELLTKKPELPERGCVGFNVNVDVVLEELVKKAENTEEEKALANKLHNASFLNRNHGSIDEKIQATIDLINASGKGIRTEYSCSSHPRYYFNLPMSFTKEEENKPFDLLGVGKDSETNEYMLAYPNDFYIRSIVPNEHLHRVFEIHSGLVAPTKPFEEIGKVPYTTFNDQLHERAQGAGNSLYNFLYIGKDTLDYIDGIDVRIAPFDANHSNVSIASNLITPLLFALEDADEVYWALIKRLEIKVMKILGVI